MVPRTVEVIFCKDAMLLLASGRFSHEFGHQASREAAVTWQKLAAAFICLAQISAHQARKQSHMRETGGQKQATVR